MRKLIIVVVLFISLFQSSTLIAQDVLRNTDLSTIKVDNLTDAEILKVQSELQNSGMTLEQAEPMALAKGMSATEFAKLKKRLEMYSPVDSQKGTVYKKTKVPDFEYEEGKEGNLELIQEKVENNKSKDTLNLTVFGSELFDNPTLNFEPNLKLATPVNYILGPADELLISVHGVQEFQDNISVSREGTIAIENVGNISVLGLTIEAATQKIRGALARVYSTISSGQSKIEITLSRIRTIKVTIIGGRVPGNYSVSSLATVYNALFLCGGPSKNGSYRNIELVRNNKIYKIVDIYRFLLTGDQSDNIGLKDNDVIRIPTYINRVRVEGEVKHPGIFEVKKGEHFSDVLNFASGFNEFAYTASVNVLQKTGKEYKVADIAAAAYKNYIPLNGDVYKISKILNRFENRIIISGAVFRPDSYSFYEGMRVSDLVAQAEGLKEDAYKNRAIIVRLKSDLTTEIVNVNLEKAMSGDLTANIMLRREDQVKVYSILDFKEDYQVTIDGEVKVPGVYTYHENLTLNDLLIEAGGLKDSASKRVEIARMMKSEEIDVNNLNKAELFNLEISANNNEQLKNFTLKPFDVINVRRMSVFAKPEMVSVSGAVAYPGKYVLVHKKEKILDVINRAGGLTINASLEGVKIMRPITKDQIEELQNVGAGKTDTVRNKLTRKLKEDLKFATIPVNWQKILRNSNDSSNIVLLPGDEIEISAFNETVKVVGGVLLTSEIPYSKGRGFNYYLDAVGGLDAKGWKKKAFIIYPNGKAAVSTSRFLFFRDYPKVTPGSQIVVPEKPLTKKLTTGEWVSIGSVISSMALLIITAFK